MYATKTMARFEVPSTDGLAYHHGPDYTSTHYTTLPRLQEANAESPLPALHTRTPAHPSVKEHVLGNVPIAHANRNVLRSMRLGFIRFPPLCRNLPLPPSPQPPPYGHPDRPKHPRHQKRFPGHCHCHCHCPSPPSCSRASASSTIRQGARVTNERTPDEISKYISQGVPIIPIIR